MTYTTISGDMWDSIAYRQLGSVNYMSKLMELNLQYHGTFIFPAGIVLELPEREDKVNSSLPPWKKGQANQ